MTDQKEIAGAADIEFVLNLALSAAKTEEEKKRVTCFAESLVAIGKEYESMSYLLHTAVPEQLNRLCAPLESGEVFE